jgi:hypothetical protein
MNGKFFQKNGVDSDKVAECLGDFDALIEKVDEWRDELESYRDELETAKSDLEDAESQDELDNVVSALRDITMPDGADTMDTTSETLADAADECGIEESGYDDWQGSMNAYLLALECRVKNMSQEPNAAERYEIERCVSDVRKTFSKGIEQIDESVGVNR